MDKYGDYEMVNGATVNAALERAAELEAELAAIKGRRTAVVANGLLRTIVVEAHMAGQESVGVVPRGISAKEYCDSLFSRQNEEQGASK